VPDQFFQQGMSFCGLAHGDICSGQFKRHKAYWFRVGVGLLVQEFHGLIQDLAMSVWNSGFLCS
jgi:hypothetical protein